MQLGMIGLGRMGANMTRRLLDGGHEVVGFDLDDRAIAAVAEEGATASASVADLVSRLEAPRAVWVMIPAGAPTEATIGELETLLEPGDTVIDGGNSRFTDSIRHAAQLQDKGIGFADAGTSGGIWGLSEGFCLMVGAQPDTFERLTPIFRSLAPAEGFAHVGPPGAGHFVKMVHNGIEYGLMQAYGEGFDLLRSAEWDLDLPRIAELWRHGSVIRSWLLDLTSRALAADPHLENTAGYVADSGEGRWTIETAIERAVPVPAAALALFARFASRRDESFSDKLIAALRHEFGGHAVGEDR